MCQKHWPHVRVPIALAQTQFSGEVLWVAYTGEKNFPLFPLPNALSRVPFWEGEGGWDPPPPAMPFFLCSTVHMSSSAYDSWDRWDPCLWSCDPSYGFMQNCTWLWNAKVSDLECQTEPGDREDNQKRNEEECSGVWKETWAWGRAQLGLLPKRPSST